MADAQLLDVPMEFGLELMAVVRCPAVDCEEINERGGANFSDAEWKLFDDAIGKIYCISLSMSVIDFQRPNPRRIRWLATHVYMSETLQAM